MYFCAQLPWRCVICPLCRNQVPMVWERRDSGKLRASAVKSRISTTRIVVRERVRSALVGSFLRSTPEAAGTDSERAGLRKISAWSPNINLSSSSSATGKVTRVPLTKEPLRLPRSTRARSPASLRWMRACRRETERLSSITAHPSPRPMAQDCPSPRGNCRPLDSTIRNGFIAEGVTVHNLADARPDPTCPRVLHRFGETTNGQPVPLGKPWDRQPNSGKLRRKLVSVSGLRRISGQLSPKRLSTPCPRLVNVGQHRPVHPRAPCMRIRLKRIILVIRTC